MSPLEVTVEQYALSVDAADTVRAVLETTDTDRGDLLAAALRLAASAAAVYVTDLNEVVASGGLPPSAPSAQVSASTVDGVLAELASSGAVGVHHLWAETSTDAYLSEGRRFTAVWVRRPFVAVRVEHAPGLPARWEGWRIAERTRIVPAGWYLLGEVGDVVTRLVGAGMLHLPESGDADAAAVAEGLAGRLVETDGFGASRCDAGCRACGARWYAESGSWHFTPDSSRDTDVPAWEFDDAEDFRDDGTIACPACGSGRAGFLIT
jgi:hypothetical protein